MQRSLRELFKLIYYLFADHKKIKITCHRLPQYSLFTYFQRFMATFFPLFFILSEADRIYLFYKSWCRPRP